jgi:hypothetical protein
VHPNTANDSPNKVKQKRCHLSENPTFNKQVINPQSTKHKTIKEVL